ncbi:MAG: disulfide bond formation protein B [Parcubacteria group bacterium]|nr:disulfide bond formation protein B [Parcubacteria group bacterium]
MVTTLSVLTLIADIIIVLAILAWIVERFHKLRFLNPVKQLVRKYSLELLFIIPLIATLGSLYLSEIKGWTPCKLCWYQRIAMYPQVILVGTALARKAKGIASYLIPLSLIGALISTLHYTEQIRARLSPLDPLAPCDLSGVSCAATPIFHFGYITIPVMAFSAFVLILIVALVSTSKSE